MLYSIVGLLVIILDQAVKYWVQNTLFGTDIVKFIPGVISLVNVHNDGAAFSFLSGSGARIYFIIATGVFTVLVIIALATNFISGKLSRWSLVLVTAGGLSNCIDRVIYGYVQDVESGMWQFIVLDFETGETVLTEDISSLYGYNNMAIGVFSGSNGNALYCPTGYRETLRLQDRFAYLPEAPYRKLDLDKTRRSVMTKEQFELEGGKGAPATWLHAVTVDNAHPSAVVAIRVNGLTGYADDLALYAYNADGALTPVMSDLWTLAGAEGELDPATVYEIHMTAEDAGVFDLNADQRIVEISAMLAYK